MSGTITEPIYCSQQIVIPPTFPHVLKLFAKAAIRTQPYDLLLWSAAYFRALSEDRVPPVKERLEYPLIRSEGGLSPQYLKILIRQMSNSEDIYTETLTKRWLGICLQEKELKEILCTAGVYMTERFPLYKFAAVAAGFLCKSLTQTMIMLCEIFTDEPDGGSAAISADFFVDLYSFLAVIDALNEVTYYDGYREEIYMANEATKKDIVVLVEEPPEEIILAPKESERWIPKLNRWSGVAHRSVVCVRNNILDEVVPAEGGNVSRNLVYLNRPPREKFTDPHRSSLEERKGDHEAEEEAVEQEAVTELAEVTEAKKPEKKDQETKGGEGDREVEEEEDEKKEEATEEIVEGAAGDQGTEGDIADVEPTTEEAKEITTEEETKTERTKDDEEGDDESEEEGQEQVEVVEEEEEKKLGRDHGVILRVYSEDGEKIESVSVIELEEEKGSEAGSEEQAEEGGAQDKEAVIPEEEEGDNKDAESEEESEEEEGSEEGSEGSPDKIKEKKDKGEGKRKKAKDVSVKERAEIIELIEKTQEKKVNDFLDVIDSIENLAEKTKMLTYDADKLGGRELAVKSGEIVAQTVERELLGRVERPDKQDPHAEAKGIVYPVLGEFFHEFFEIVGEVKDLHIPDIVVVPGKPGIGACVPPAMMEEVLRYVRETAADQCDMFMPRDLRHCLCPPLERHLSMESIA